MGQWNVLYDMYERRLKAELSDAAVPKHIGVILDGNRRWAKSLGATASQGHRAGAGKIAEFLDWSEDAGVSIVTLWLLSTDNLARDEGELGVLLRIIVRGRLPPGGPGALEAGRRRRPSSAA